jgi:hypothetical protein
MPVGGALGGPAGRPVGGSAVGFCKNGEHGGKHAQAQREQHGIGRAAVQAGRFVEAGEVGKVRTRAAGFDRLGDHRRRSPRDAGPRDGLGPAEDGEHEETHREGAAGGAFGEERQGEQRRRDALRRPPVLQRTRHLRASFARAYPAARSEGGG